MMRRSLDIFIITLFTGFVCILPVLAQTVPVRTGEHATFTRVVLDFNERPGWQIGRNNGRYELWLDTASVDFDLTDAFRRLQGQRLLDLTDLGQGRLALTLACNCGLSVATLQNEGLLIDILDQPPAEGNPWLKELTDARLEASIELENDTNEIGILNLSKIPSLLSFPKNSMTIEQTQIEANLLKSLQEKLVEQTSRAASQGLILFNNSPRIDDRLIPPSRRDSAMKDVNPSAQASLAKGLEYNNRVETDYDRHRKSMTVLQIDEWGAQCSDSNIFNISDWFANVSVLDQLGIARMRLYDERGQKDPSGYANLAKMLIYLSFGLEAQAVLNEGPAEIPQRDILLEMASIMDGGISDTDIFSKQAHCEPEAAMWMLLDHDVKLNQDELDLNAIVRTVSSLPQHLRQYLGPRIINKLISVGLDEVALSIRNSVSRGNHGESTGMKMIQAQFDWKNGNKIPAMDEFRSIATTRSSEAVHAINHLIQNLILTNRHIPDEIISQAIAMAFELDDNSDLESLPHTIIMAMVHQARFGDALVQLEIFGDREHFTEERKQQIRGEIFFSLAEGADDVTFLSLTANASSKGEIPHAAALKIASRLTDLGMAAQARAALGEQNESPGDEARFILARIAMLENDRNTALNHLAGLQTPEAQDLRIRAEKIDDKIAIDDIASTSGRDSDLQSEAVEQREVGALERNQELLSNTRQIREDFLSLLQGQSN